MATTTPHDYTDDGNIAPTLSAHALAGIHEGYTRALADVDKADLPEDAAYDQGRLDAFDEVLTLLHQVPERPAYKIVLRGEEIIGWLPIPEPDGGQEFLSIRYGDQDVFGIDVTNMDDDQVPTVTVGRWVRENDALIADGWDRGEWVDLHTYKASEHDHYNARNLDH